jgi:mRNA interferase MazF
MNMNQSEIWMINLDPVIGAEMRKTRPALIISSDRAGRLPLRVVVPITGWKEHFSAWPWMVRIEPTTQNGLVKVSSADCFQIRSVSVDRMLSRLGVATPEIVTRTQKAIAQVCGVF